jgi:(R,R)-butanediol dehydrogenase/meso-butanediol dehydrogenase/diacetyl reductase
MGNNEQSMLAVRLHGRGDIRLDTVARPTHHETSALVKVAWASICGTDLHAYTTGPRWAPIILGHEFSGTIVETPSPENYPVGTKVVVDPAYACLKCEYCLSGRTSYCERMRICGFDSPGGLAEYAEVPLSNLLPLPSEIDLYRACLIEPLSCAHHAVERAKIHKEASVLIMGAGSLGLGIASLLHSSDIKQIVICEPDPLRRIVAQKVGIGVVIDPSDTETSKSLRIYLSKIGASVAFETSGQTSALRLAFGSVMKGGQVIVVALYKQNWSIDTSELFGKELGLIWSLGALRSDFKKVMQLLVAGILPPLSWIQQTELTTVSSKLFDQLDTGKALKPLIRVTLQ